MENRLDRLENDIEEWEAREKRFQKLFGAAVVDSKPYLKEKLAFYEGLELKYGSKASHANQLGKGLIQQQRRKLENRVYPNLLVRSIYRIIKAVIANQVRSGYERTKSENIQALQQRVRTNGVDGFDNKIAVKVQQESKPFSINEARFINEAEKIDYDWQFAKGLDGQYHLQGCLATLSDHNNANVKSCFVENPAITPEQIYNLLSNRPVLITEPEQKPYWLQLDQNDKDPEGNFKFRKILVGNDFDIVKSLEGLPLNREGLDLKVVAVQLANGDAVKAVLFIKEKEKVISLAANPMRREVSVLDENKQRVQIHASNPISKKVVENMEQSDQQRRNRKQMRIAGR